MNQNLQMLVHEKYEMMIQKRDTEIMSLNIQMNPHFLYNSLNIINWVCLKGEQENASKMLLDLSRMLQYTSRMVMFWFRCGRIWTGLNGILELCRKDIRINLK